ncbi:MAG: tetratricopeptide repeat protein, partial [Candidatus Brocadiales bacterium]
MIVVLLIAVGLNLSGSMAPVMVQVAEETPKVMELPPAEYQIFGGGRAVTREYARELYREGLRLRRKGELEKSRSCLAKAVQLYPELYDAWYSLGVVQNKLGRHGEAVASFDVVLNVYPEDMEALVNKGVALRKLRRWEEAVECFDEVLLLDGENLTALYNKGAARSAQGAYGATVDAAASVDKGNVIDIEETYKEAIELFDKAIELDPYDINAWYDKGEILLRQNKSIEALECFNTMIKIFETNEAGKKMARAYAEQWLSEGLALGEEGRHKESLGFFAKAVRIYPVHFEAWYNMGMAQAKLGKYEEAVASFNMALTVSPLNIKALGNKGVALLKMGEWEEAERCFDDVLSIDKGNVLALYNKGVASSLQGMYREAIESFDRILELEPSNVKALEGKGLALMRLNKNAEALACFDTIVEIDDSSEALANKAMVLIKMGENEEAMDI